MPEDALGCRPSVTVAVSGPNPVLRSQLPATEGGGVHALSANHGGGGAAMLGASPVGKSVGLPSLASLISSDSSRDVYQQRVQVSTNDLAPSVFICLVRMTSTPCLKKNDNDVAHYNFNAH